MNHLHRYPSPIFYYAILGCFMIMVSCKERSAVPLDENMTLVIAKSSGDDFFYGETNERKYFAPYPFNVGFIELPRGPQEVMLISKQQKVGARIDILPIAKMAIREKNGNSKEIFIAVPKDDDLAIISQMSFSEFTVEQFSLKQLVEYWYSNRYGLQGTSIKGWAPSDLDDFK